MRVDVTIGGRFLVQPVKAQRQRDVFHHVREVSRVKGMPVIQVTLLCTSDDALIIALSPMKLA